MHHLTNYLISLSYCSPVPSRADVSSHLILVVIKLVSYCNDDSCYLESTEIMMIFHTHPMRELIVLAKAIASSHCHSKSSRYFSLQIWHNRLQSSYQECRGLPLLFISSFTVLLQYIIISLKPNSNQNSKCVQMKNCR